MIAFVVAVGVGLAVVGLTWAAWIQSQAPEALPPPSAPPRPRLPPSPSRAWVELGASLGLEARGLELVGQRDGVDLEVHGNPSTDELRVQLRMPLGLPDAGRIGLGPGGVARDGPGFDLRWWFEDEGVDALGRELCERVRGYATYRQLDLFVPPSELSWALDHGAAFVLALTERRVGAIERAAALLGHEGAVGPQTDVLEGEVDGIGVWMMLPFTDGTRWACSFRLTLPDPLPLGTVVVPEDLGVGPEDELGDLFLDTALHVRTSDPEALRERLARDEVRGPLLEVICEGVGSRLDHEVLIWICRRGALAVDERLAEALKLVRDMAPR